ncbi:MAG: hypothetical protein KOO69_07390 [Victivallales bacterium]|nr:hypothetical protein [Victivallales bacterium]
MKYYKPEIHSISATKANATCVDGSNAIPIAECVTGGDVADRRCRAGLAAFGQCRAGTAAGRRCRAGISFGVGCASGTSG